MTADEKWSALRERFECIVKEAFPKYLRAVRMEIGMEVHVLGMTTPKISAHQSRLRHAHHALVMMMEIEEAANAQE